MKLTRPISLVLLCIAFVPSLALGQTPQIDDLREKAEKGDAEAQLSLGLRYVNGERIEKDFNKGIKWLRKAAEQKNMEAQFSLGLINMFGNGLKKNEKAGFKFFKQAAENGHMISSYNLAVCYQNGNGVKQNKIESAKWFRVAANMGHDIAQNNLALIYLKGIGVRKDDNEGVRWMTKSAMQGYSEAQYNLGVMYSGGVGVKKDKKEFFKWTKKAATQGHLKSKYNLGIAWYKGQGVSKDYFKSYKWLKEASESGLAEAQLILGSMYANGQGVEQNYVNSAKWFLRSANQGNSKSQLRIAILYLLGNGVPKDNIESYKWYNISAAKGLDEAKQGRDLVQSEMSIKQVAEAQKRSSLFKPKLEISTYKKTNDFDRGSIIEMKPDLFGSGFFVTSHGYILTNQHVVNGARKVFVHSESQRFPAKVIKTDAANDLALLKVSGSFAALPVSSSRRVKLGQTVSTVGFPNPNLQGKSPKLTKGEISSLSGASDDPKYFQISVPLQPGNSGGPLVDGYGNVIGVVTAKLNAKAALDTSGNLPENVNYAIKGTFIMGFLESVPDVAAEMLDPKPRRSREFTEVVSDAEKASVMILVYE